MHKNSTNLNRLTLLYTVQIILLFVFTVKPFACSLNSWLNTEDTLIDNGHLRKQSWIPKGYVIKQLRIY